MHFVLKIPGFLRHLSNVKELEQDIDDLKVKQATNSSKHFVFFLNPIIKDSFMVLK